MQNIDKQTHEASNILDFFLPDIPCYPPTSFELKATLLLRLLCYYHCTT